MEFGRGQPISSRRATSIAVPGDSPTCLAQGNMSRLPSRLVEDVARSGVLVVWELPLALTVLASGSRRRIRNCGGGCGCGVQARRAVPLFYLLGASSERAENPRWRWRGRGAKRDGRGVRVAGRASSQRVPVWRARRARQGGEAAFCLDIFCSSSAVPERFLDWPSFCRHNHSCEFGNDKTRRIAEGPISGIKAEPSVATREPSTMAPKGALWQGPGPI